MAPAGGTFGRAGTSSSGTSSSGNWPGREPAAGQALASSRSDSQRFGNDEAAAYGKGGEFDLGDEDIRLPWLEGDDEDYEEQGGFNAQTAILIASALLAIALMAGGIVWALQDRGGSELVADGGVIEAPAEPYKTRPQDPGGEVVDGTGDTSFAVAEGQSRTPSIAPGEDGPRPGFESIAEPSPSTSAEAPAPAPSEPAVSGVGVQVGAYTSKADAEAGWNALKVQYADLAGIDHRVLQGQADIGTVFRLQAVPGDLAAAKRLCSGMKAAGLSCQVKK
ncbi:SPOR domain-containing protein [Novosphingobium sp. YJ-S2-02]|uniref:SPOR domain-containing protein n=2 Tax=Novosphingobium aureum TaxID=2792964 RepID=A0A931H9F6_9SPHN|nr:SPOR domain-containing protein [Novosphingobium aureum]